MEQEQIQLETPQQQVVDFYPTKKQELALKYLYDDTTSEILWGGGLYGGKTWLGCFWLISSCLKYPGSRWLLGRAVLKHLKESSLRTLLQMLNEVFHYEKDIHYFYNETKGTIKFWNGSEIVLKDLELYPSDPYFSSLGSTEYSGCFLDEMQEISRTAKDMVLTRLRYKLKKFKIIGKCLMCANPNHGFLYMDFYKPWVNKTLPKYRVFIQALLSNNPYADEKYVETLKRQEGTNKQRLLYGDWDYSEAENELFQFDKITDIFTNPQQQGDREQYLAIDPARLGKNNCVFVKFRGLHIERIRVYPKSTNDQIVEKINQIKITDGIPSQNIVLDCDGIGGMTFDDLKKMGLDPQPFVNNSSPIVRKHAQTGIYTKVVPERVYANLKAQCYDLLSSFVNGNKISCYKEIPSKYRELLVEDLQQIKRKNPDTDSKFTLVPKEQIKEILGHSTDISDCLAMFMIFHIKKPLRVYWAK